MRQPTLAVVTAAAAAALVLSAPRSASAQLRVVDYNTAGDARDGLGNVLAAIGAESADGIVRPIDVLALEEQDSSATTTQAIVSLLNAKYGAGTYARSTVDGGTTGAGRPGLIYRVGSVQLVATTTASTTSTSGAARQTMRYQLRPVGYTSSADLYLYASHYKSSDTTEDAARRGVEAAQVRANADALGQGAHAIFAGDFNIYRSSEPMWANLTAAGNGQAFDPINRVGTWSNNSSFKDVHTQSPATTAKYGGQITGGLDDRFDFQLVTGEMQDGEGLSYIPGTYRVFGNTNTHAINGAITSGSASALAARLPGYTVAQATTVLTDLERVTDHLPVVADYQLPARMGVTVADAAPSKVIRGASAGLTLAVRNAAPVATATGADELDYTLSATGGLTVAGTPTGTVAPLAPANNYTVAVDTSSPGIKTGTATVTATSQGAADPTFSQGVAVTVVGHATPSFAGGATASPVTTKTLNLGQFAVGGGDGLMAVALADLIANLQDPSGFTAGLDLDSIIAQPGGPTSSALRLTGLFDTLAAGSAADLSAGVDTVSPGTFTTTFLLGLSDEDLPGATAPGSNVLSLTLSATVVPEPTSAALGLLALFGGLPGRRRTRRAR